MIKNLSGRESLTKILNVDESKCKDKIKHIFSTQKFQIIYTEYSLLVGSEKRKQTEC